jgi:cytochrome c biogenesis protein CcmG, thiol:disulfide interchange protein DsbE
MQDLSCTRRGALALPLLALGAPARALEAGALAPAIKLPGLQGEVDLAAMAGQLVYVDFWASWCGPCKLSFAWMNELLARHQAQGLRVVAVNVDARRADADRFLAANPARFTIAFDDKGDTPRRWNVKTMPSSGLVGRNGRLLWLHRGFRDEDRPDLDARVAAALAGR